SREERAQVPYHAIDVADPGETFSAGRWAREARPIIESIAARGRLPIVCGGGGVFIQGPLCRPPPGGGGGPAPRPPPPPGGRGGGSGAALRPREVGSGPPGAGPEVPGGQRSGLGGEDRPGQPEIRPSRNRDPPFDGGRRLVAGSGRGGMDGALARREDRGAP